VEWANLLHLDWVYASSEALFNRWVWPSWARVSRSGAQRAWTARI